MTSLRLQSTAVLVAVLALVLPDVSSCRVFSTVEDALSKAFPGCTVERTTVYLTEQQREGAAELAGLEIPSAIVYPYVASCDSQYGGTAYFDAHRVRTLPETLMVIVSPNGDVVHVEVLSFDEPEEYIPRTIWYQQFTEEPLDDDLQLGRGIDGVTGATLTARATTEAVRRILALHRILEVSP